MLAGRNSVESNTDQFRVGGHDVVGQGLSVDFLWRRCPVLGLLRRVGIGGHGVCDRYAGRRTKGSGENHGRKKHNDGFHDVSRLSWMREGAAKMIWGEGHCSNSGCAGTTCEA